MESVESEIRQGNEFETDKSGIMLFYPERKSVGSEKNIDRLYGLLAGFCTGK